MITGAESLALPIREPKACRHDAYLIGYALTLVEDTDAMTDRATLAELHERVRRVAQHRRPPWDCCWGSGPDEDRGVVEIRIYPESQALRNEVASLLPEGTYVIVVEPSNPETFFRLPGASDDGP